MMRFSPLRACNLTDAIGCIVLITGAILLPCIFWPMQRSEAPLAVPRMPVAVADTPIRGSATAPVGILEFADFQCPFCARFSRDTLPVLDREYFETGIAFFAIRQAPLSIHVLAR